MIDWSHLPFLLAVSRAGSLSSAARALKVDPATVGRHVGALEREIGAKLFRKKGKALEPTEAGAALLDAALRTDDTIAQTLRQVRAETARPSGVVRLTTVEILATSYVAPRLVELRKRHPELVVDMVVTPQILDLSRQVDLALRLVRPTDDALVTKRAGIIEMAVYASRAHAKNPVVDAIAYGDHFIQAEENAWIDRHARVVARTTSVNAAVAAVASGLGAAMIPVSIAEARGDLIRLKGSTKREVWLAMHPDLAKSPRVRAVAEFLCEVVR